ncbi:MAG TPA: restriction endonuclease subunit S [Chloroflexota bacterium]|nr:restriction endonuclease subunit S [Chloroflexota bacterium]
MTLGTQDKSLLDGVTLYPSRPGPSVEWLGSLPDHWGTPRLKTCASNMVETVSEREPGEMYLALEHVEGWTGRIRPASEETTFDSAVKRFRANDVLFGKLRPYLAKVARAPRSGVCVGEFLVLRPRDGAVLPDFLAVLLRSKPVIDVINSSTFGAKMPRAEWQFIGDLRLPLPPLSEQAAIVRYLDHADRRIQRAIRAKKRLIALLNEQKAAIIHRAVTRGLDPSVPLKPSRVEWLGDVPAHWDVMPLKHVVPQVTVGIVIQPASLYVDSGVPCLRSLNVSGGTARSENLVYISPESNQLHRKSQIFDGDIVVVRTGRAGVAAIVPREYDGANCIDLLIVRRSERILSEYLLTYLNSWAARTDVQYRSVGAIQSHYNTETLANLVTPLPSLAEQRRILDRLALETRPVDQLLSATQSEIALLQEFRTRLISDVVTGKLDVRQAAANLPDIGDEEPAIEDDPAGEETAEESDDLAEELAG